MDQKMNTLFDILMAGSMKPVTVNDLKRLTRGKIFCKKVLLIND